MFVTSAALSCSLSSNDGGPILLIDVRQAYEYEGGHITGAVLADWRTDGPSRIPNIVAATCRAAGAAPTIVVYCEFGGKRSPDAYTKIRAVDRASSGRGGLRHPYLYVLHGGYSRFFSQHPELC